MSFFSTRGGACVTASQAILWGLAKDGGLYVPSMFPQLSSERMASLCGASYQEQAARILRDYLEDYTIAEIEQSVNAAYDDKHFDDPAVTPLHTLMPDVHVLELFHGPTLAFKDVALNLLPHLIRLAAKKNDEEREISILVATSGDTGKAALEGFKDVPGTRLHGILPLRRRKPYAGTADGHYRRRQYPRHRREGQFRRRADRREASVLQRGIPGEDERHGQAAQLGQFH